MSDKPKRDITLGEMKDECDKNHKNATPCGFCVYKDVCSYKQQHGLCWIDLTDPPRFTDAQMELLRGMYAIGARTARSTITGVCFYASEGASIPIASTTPILGQWLLLGETLDLVEMFGKEKK